MNNNAIDRQELIRNIEKLLPPMKENHDDLLIGYSAGIIIALSVVQRMKPVKTKGMNNHDIAELLSDLFGDTCACNFFGIDEWLPCYCELEKDCPYPSGVACWEQFLKYWDKHKGI